MEKNSKVSQSIISLTNIGMAFENGKEVLVSVSFSLKKNEFISIIGPSGCGKTTILDIMARLTKPTSGDIYYNGDANDANLSIGYVFQKPVLLPWLSAKGNIELPTKINSKFKADPTKHLKDVGLEGFKDYLPSQLSGGMRQRLALARALSTEPDVLLLDEPFSAVDDITRFELNDLTANLWLNSSMSCALVTHNIEEAVYLSSRVILLGNNPATIVEQFTVPIPYPRQQTIRSDSKFIEIVKCIRQKIQN